jgi:hypothetical protein
MPISPRRVTKRKMIVDWRLLVDDFLFPINNRQGNYSRSGPVLQKRVLFPLTNDAAADTLKT